MPENSSISDNRKFLYTLGGGLMVIGFLLFLCPFVFGIMSMRNGPGFNMASESRSAANAFGAAFVGFILLFIGGFIRGTAAKGLAGSGVILDPDQAREDLKPWNKAAGGMTSDILQEIPVVQKFENAIDRANTPTTSQPTKEVIKIRCQACKTLNDEDATFCKNCAVKL